MTQMVGYLDENVLGPHLKQADGKTKVFVCGPGGFNESIKKICEARGYGLENTKDLLHFF